MISNLRVSVEFTESGPATSEHIVLVRLEGTEHAMPLRLSEDDYERLQTTGYQCVETHQQNAKHMAEIAAAARKENK